MRGLGSIFGLLLCQAAAAGPFAANDPDIALAWHLQKLNLPQAWSYSLGSPSVTIAFIDTGVIASTPDLAGRVLPALGTPLMPVSDGYANHHGTWVASVAAGGVNNGIGAAGIGNFSILPITAADAQGFTSDDDLAAGIRLAANMGAKVISVSAGALSYGRLNAAATDARAKGALTFISAGNGDSRKDMGQFSSLIFVSGTDENDQRWSSKGFGSNWGPYVDLAAPAADIYAADPTTPTGYVIRSGTSFSAPLAAGAAALAWSINPDLSADQVQSMLYHTAVDLGDPGWDEVYGWGRIDVGAMAAAAEATIPEPSTFIMCIVALSVTIIGRVQYSARRDGRQPLDVR